MTELLTLPLRVRSAIPAMSAVVSRPYSFSHYLKLMTISDGRNRYRITAGAAPDRPGTRSRDTETPPLEVGGLHRPTVHSLPFLPLRSRTVAVDLAVLIVCKPAPVHIGGPARPHLLQKAETQSCGHRSRDTFRPPGCSHVTNEQKCCLTKLDKMSKQSNRGDHYSSIETGPATNTKMKGYPTVTRLGCKIQ